MDLSVLALLGASNFLAAVGGGTILGKGMGVLRHPWLKGGSLLALIVGTPLGLAWLSVLPSAVLPAARGCLCFGGALTSLALLALFLKQPRTAAPPDGREVPLTGAAALVFFFLLCLRFSLWFVPRVLRSDAASGNEGLIGWVEASYYGGLTLGLTLWVIRPPRFGGRRLGLTAALVVDAVLQIVAGGLDLLAAWLAPAGTAGGAAGPPLPIDWAWFARLTIAVTALTIGTQIVLFDFAHRLAEDPADPSAEESFAKQVGYADGRRRSTFVVAAFYAGVALAAVPFAASRIEADWTTGWPRIHAAGHPEWSFPLAGIAALGLAVLVVWAAGSRFRWLGAWTLALVLVAAFLYELPALALLDQIGREAHAANRSGLVAVAFCCMGLAAGISLWVLGAFRARFRTWLLVSGGCALLCLAAVVVKG